MNKDAIELVSYLEKIESGEYAHWSLSDERPSHREIDKNCLGEKSRAYFLCLVEYLAKSHESAGVLFLNADDESDPVFRYFQGAALFRKEIDDSIAIWQTVPNVSHYLARQALKMHQSGDIASSIAILEASEAVSQHAIPEMAPSYLALCQSLIENKQKSKALDFCKKAQYADSSWINQVKVARAYLSINENERALNIAASLIEKGEGVGPALRINGVAYSALGEYKKALVEYSQLQALGPLDRYTMYELAELYYKMENLDQAKILFEVLHREYGDDRALGFLKIIDERQ